MRQDRMTVPTFLITLVLASMISFSCVMCLRDAFSMEADTGLLLAICCGAALLAAAAMVPKRSWPFVLAGAGVYFGVLLWKHSALLESLEYVLFRISCEYALCFDAVQIIGKETGSALWILGVLGVPLTGITAWVTGREGSAVLVIMACLPVLILCLLIVELAPILWLVLLTGAMMVLVISHSVRERNPAEGSLLAWWLMLPTIILVSGITVLWPPADYARTEWSNALQTFAQTRLELEPQQEERPAAAPKWNRELKEVDLSRVGPKSMERTPVLDYRSDVRISYLRGVSLGVYEKNTWESVSSAAYRAEGVQGEPLLPVGDGASMLEVRTDSGNPLLYTTYYLSELPTDAQTVDDAYVQNSMRVTSYTMFFSPYLQNLTPMPTEYDRFVAERYLQIPEELQEPLAEIVAAAGLQQASAETVANYVRSSGVYDLNTPSIPNGEEFVLYFLQESHRGYCVHFASATTMLLRSVGIPARYVTGYLVSGPVNQWNEVTEADAHAWVEYYAAGQGWMPLDPTPASAGAEPVQPQTPQTPDDAPQEADQPEQKPEYDIAPQQSPPQKQPVQPEQRSLQLQKLWWLMMVPCVGLLVWLRRIIGLRYRRERCAKGHPNRRALIWWRWLVQFSKAEKVSISEELVCLAEKARFSQHTMQQEELDCLQLAVEQRIDALRQTSFWKRMWYQYGLVLF